MFLRDTLEAVLRDQRLPHPADTEVSRELLSTVQLRDSHAIVFQGVRRCGKSVLQAQLLQKHPSAQYCNLEDVRLFGLAPDDFPTLLAILKGAGRDSPVFLDEVQEVAGWERLVRALLDAGHRVCVTGSNASLLGRELGSKLTGRHLSFEVYPFSYREYLDFVGSEPGRDSLLTYLEDGGFPGYLGDRDPMLLQQLLRDIVQRDIAVRHGLRETRHVMNLLLFLLANTGQPLSFQNLTRAAAVPTVAQTSRYMELLQDGYALLSVPKFSASFKQRVVAPKKYYAIDTGFRRVNSPQLTPDRGHRLENAILLELRRQAGEVTYAGDRNAWECDFVTPTHCIQVCEELTPYNQPRETTGLQLACRLPGSGKREPLILTLDQQDDLRAGSLSIAVRPAWKWLLE